MSSRNFVIAGYELTCLTGYSYTGIQMGMGIGILAVNWISNYEHLYALVEQGLADTVAPYQNNFKEFLEQLARHREEAW